MGQFLQSEKGWTIENFSARVQYHFSALSRERKDNYFTLQKFKLVFKYNTYFFFFLDVCNIT